VTSVLPYLLTVGLVPSGVSLLLFIATRIEGTLPSDQRSPEA
jgi:hypothetical protein